jgi:hypothetical protein
MKRSHKVLIVFAAIALAMQFAPVNRDNPPGHEPPALPDDVRMVLERSCNDCHSHLTRWPWYTNVAPVSWWIAHHVEEGREHLNFSTWQSLSPKDRSKAAEEIAEEVREGKMPLASYVVGHPEAALSDVERGLLVAWADSLAKTSEVTATAQPEAKEAEEAEEAGESEAEEQGGRGRGRGRSR